MREIVLDTETTGLDPKTGDRIVEIACLELSNHMATGSHYQAYVNPQGRESDPKALATHGLTNEFLAAQPVFAEVVEDFLAFIGEDPLIIHNAAFDLGFINAELARLERPPIGDGRAIDTLILARRKLPGARVSLDDLCKRFGVDLSGRGKHGALVDCRLLAEVYLELAGGRQPGLELSAQKEAGGPATAERTERPARPHAPSTAEAEDHAAFIEDLPDSLWRL